MDSEQKERNLLKATINYYLLQIASAIMEQPIPPELLRKILNVLAEITMEIRDASFFSP